MSGSIATNRKIHQLKKEVKALKCCISNGQAGAVYYNRAWLTQTVSYETYDEGYRVANGANDYNEAIPIGALVQQKDFTGGLFDRLKYFNIWGSKFRFTGLTGGYCNPEDGLFYNVDGVLSDKATEFPFYAAARALIVDHLTGLMVISDRLGAQTWTLWLPETPGRTDAGYTDWFAPAWAEEQMLTDTELIDALNYIGNEPRRGQFNFSQATNLSSTTNPSNSAQCIRFFCNSGGGYKNFSTKIVTGANRIFWRVELTEPVAQP